MLGWCQWLGKGSDKKSKDENDFYLKNVKHMYQVDEVRMKRLIMVESMVWSFWFWCRWFHQARLFRFGPRLMKIDASPRTGWTHIEVTWWLSCGPMSLVLKLIFGAGRPVNTMQSSQKVGLPHRLGWSFLHHLFFFAFKYRKTIISHERWSAHFITNKESHGNMC